MTINQEEPYSRSAARPTAMPPTTMPGCLFGALAASCCILTINSALA